MIVSDYPIYSKYSKNTSAISHKGLKSFLSKDLGISRDTFEKTTTQDERDLIYSIVGDDKDVKRNRDFNPNDLPIRYYKAIDKKKSNLLFNYISDSITCYLDKNDRIDKVLRFNQQNRDVSIYDKNGEILKYYTPDETDALLKYKGNSTAIHDVLRYNKTVKKQEIVENCINTMDSIFKNQDKVDVTEEDMYVYRALDPYSVKQIKQNLSEGKMTFVDPSFVSVSTDKEVPKFFANKNIAKIKIPKGTKYISMDEFANIEYSLQQEKELLLNKNSKFSFTNTKDEDGFFEVEYIGE